MIRGFFCALFLTATVIGIAEGSWAGAGLCLLFAALCIPKRRAA